MSLLTGFASVNEEAGQSALGQTLEAQEQRAISAYEHALSLIKAQRADEAEAALRALLAEPVVDGCATDQLHRIKFLTLKNLAELLARRPGGSGTADALAVYCTATKVAGDDAGLWNKLGTLAAEAGYWAAARDALEQGLALEPQHPTMADKLLQLLLHVGDTEAAGAVAEAVAARNPRHAAAAAVLAQRRRGGAPAALRAGLLQLAPAGGGGQPACGVHHHPHAERPRTLEQPTWQQLLHHSLLFLAGNRLAEGGASAHAAATSAASPPGVPPAWAERGHKAVASLVRFTYKRPPAPPAPAPQARQQQAQPGTAAAPGGGAAEQQEELPAAGTPAAGSIAGQPADAEGPTAGGRAAAVAAGVATGDAPVAAAEAPMAAAGAADGGGPAATPQAAAHAIIGAPEASAATPAEHAGMQEAGLAGAGGTGPAALRETSPAGEGRAQEQEQRHPNGSAGGAGGGGSGRKHEGRATRSRAASGKAGPPLVPPGVCSGGEAQPSPAEEAAELLGLLGSLLSVPQQPAPATPAAAASPLLSSPGVYGRGAGGGGGGGQQAAAAQQQQGEEEAVKALLKRLPPQGIGRHDLAMLLLGTLGTPAAAAALLPAARHQLLQLAHHVQHSVPHLPASRCLVLGELFADAAVAASSSSSSRQQPGLALATPSSAAGSGSEAGQRPSGRGRRTDLAAATLHQSAQLWLSRFRLAGAEAEGASAHVLGRLGGPAGGADASDGAAAAGGEPAGMVRYWWATGRLLASSGDMLAASEAFSTCEEGLHLLGGSAIPLPHCTADGEVSLAAVRGKQEALQLHEVLAAAEGSAAAGDQAAVVSALAPLLLCCTTKEQAMVQLDGRQWLRGMHMLLEASGGAGAGAGGSGGSSNPGMALRCHLRLLNALLPHVPDQLAALMRGGADQGGVGGGAAAAPLPSLLAAAEQLAAQPAATAALDAAAAFLHRHEGLLALAASRGSKAEQPPGQQQQQQQQAQEQRQQQVELHPMEGAMYEAVMHQLVLAVAGCGAALAAAGPAAAQSQLNMKANAERSAMCDAAAVLLRLSSLASASGSAAAATAGAAASAAGLQAVEQAQELAWLLCDCLGAAQALMERRGRFVQVCLSELRSQLARLEWLIPQLAFACPPADGGIDAEELHAALTAGLQHCLYWLYGLELPGLDRQEEWGGDFQVKGAAEAAARQLTSRQAVAAVWPLVHPLLLADLDHLPKHRAFIQAAAAQFPEPPPSVAASSALAWRQLAAVEPPMLPSDELDSLTSRTPMEQLLWLAAQRGGAQEGPPGSLPRAAPEPGAEPMRVDGEEQPGAAGGELPACGQWGEDAQQYADVVRSLYHLVSLLRDAEPDAGGSLLGEGAEAALEVELQHARWDLGYNPLRAASWERLAAGYHSAADGLLNEASGALSYREWRHNIDLQHRVRRWRRLAYWASAGAWLSATDDDQRVRLLLATGSRLMEDELCTLPCRDPLACRAAWQRAKGGERYRRAFQLARAAFDLMEAILEEEQDDAADWFVLLSKARCLRKLRQPAVNWLPLMARAARNAAKYDGGVLRPLYALHAARMRLLLGMPSARCWAAGADGGSDGHGGSSGRRAPASRGGQGGRSEQRRQQQQAEQQALEQDAELLRVIGDYCFLPSTNRALRSPPARGGRARPQPAAAAPPVEELRADWRSLVEDCCAAMRWCLDRDKNFHRAAYRLAAALQQAGEPHKAVAVLAPLFSRAKQAFLPVMLPIQEAKVDSGGKRGRGRPNKTKQQRGAGAGGGEEAAAGAEGGLPPPDCSWGEAPARLSSVGMEEDEARKTLCLYLSCLVDAAMAGPDGLAAEAGRPPPLDVLQAAAGHLAAPAAGASKAWEGASRLARGHFLLALLAGLRAACPLEQLQIEPQAPPSAAQLSAATPSAGPPPVPVPVPAAAAAAGEAGAAVQIEPSGEQGASDTAAHQTPGAPLRAAAGAAAGSALRRALPTPATQARQQLAARLLHVAAALDAGSVGPLLAKAYQVFAECSLRADSDDAWRTEAAPSVQEAQSVGTCQLASDVELQQLCADPQLLKKVLSLYATLYVHLLQHQGDAEQLLQLLLAVKKRLRSGGAAELRQARALRRDATVLAGALLGTLEASLAAAELESGFGQQQAAAGVAALAGPAPMPAGALQPVAATGEGPAARSSPDRQLAQQHQQEERDSVPAAGAQQQQRQAAGDGDSPGAPAAADAEQQTAAKTPAAVPGGGAAGEGRRTPGTELRRLLGTPGALPTAEQQQLAERCMALLQVAVSFHRDLARWLQAFGAAAGGSSVAVREELRALGSRGEEAVLRAYRLCSAAGSSSGMGRAEQLKAAEETAKQQRRQSRQQGAGAGAGGGARQLAAAAASAAAGGGALPAVAEGAEEQLAAPAAAAGGARKRGAAAAGGDKQPPRSTRKRARSGTAETEEQSRQAELPLDGTQAAQEAGEGAADAAAGEAGGSAMDAT